MCPQILLLAAADLTARLFGSVVHKKLAGDGRAPGGFRSQQYGQAVIQVIQLQATGWRGAGYRDTEYGYRDTGTGIQGLHRGMVIQVLGKLSYVYKL